MTNLQVVTEGISGAGFFQVLESQVESIRVRGRKWVPPYWGEDQHYKSQEQRTFLASLRVQPSSGPMHPSC